MARAKLWDYVNGMWMREKCEHDDPVNATSGLYWTPWVQPDNVTVNTTFVPGQGNIHGKSSAFQGFGGPSIVDGLAFDCNFGLARYGLYRIQYWFTADNDIAGGAPGNCPGFDDDWGGGRASTDVGNYIGVYTGFDPGLLSANEEWVDTYVKFIIPDYAAARNVTVNAPTPPYTGSIVQYEDNRKPEMVGMTLHFGPPDYIDPGEAVNYYLVPYRETPPSYGPWFDGGFPNAYQSGPPEDLVAESVYIGTHSSGATNTIDWEVPEEYVGFPEDKPGSARYNGSFSDGSFSVVSYVKYGQAYMFHIFVVTSRVRDNDSPHFTGTGDMEWKAYGFHFSADYLVRPARYRYSVPPRPLKGWDYENDLWSTVACMIPDTLYGEPVEAELAVRSFSTTTTSATGTLTIDPPSGVQSGDLQVLFVGRFGVGTMLTPADWTDLSKNFFGAQIHGHSLNALTKISDGSESTVTVNFDPDQNGDPVLTPDAVWVCLEGAPSVESASFYAYNGAISAFTTPPTRTGRTLFCQMHNAETDIDQSDFEFEAGTDVVVNPLTDFPSGGVSPRRYTFGVARSSSTRTSCLDVDDFGYWPYVAIDF